jgi:hypothetical protein
MSAAVTCPVDAANIMTATTAIRSVTRKKAIRSWWESIALLERGVATRDLLVRFTTTMKRL